MKGKYWSGGIGLLLGVIGLVMSGCTSDHTIFNKDELAKVKSVGVVMYTVPLQIKVKDNPRDDDKKSSGGAMGVLKSLAVAAANTGDGHRAATLAEQTFIDTLNEQGLPFKALTVSQIQANANYVTLARESREAVEMVIAKRKEEREKKQGGMGKAMNMLASFSGGGAPSEEAPIGASPDGQPTFGLVPMFSTTGALTGVPNEHDYLAKAAEALGVDAVLVVNDPGMSWGCETCINYTGNASTQSVFFVSIVDRSGKTILQMDQWFTIGGGNAAMVSGVINPLQHDGLFKGHGEKTARVFADWYKERAAK